MLFIIKYKHEKIKFKIYWGFIILYFKHAISCVSMNCKKSIEIFHNGMIEVIITVPHDCHVLVFVSLDQCASSVQCAGSQCQNLTGENSSGGDELAQFSFWMIKEQLL